MHCALPSDAVFVPPKRSTQYELADIVERYLGDYLKAHKLSDEQWRVINAIRNCRTAKMGVHVRKCDECHFHEIAYNSCRDRHCPKCQGSVQVRWVKQRLADLLPIPYYHLVFTMPHELNDLCLCNKAILYEIFFKTTAETLHTFAKDQRFLGGDIGFISVLHTWGQGLWYHVHLHIIVPGGGLCSDKNEWKALPYQEKFIFPVKALSKRLRKLFTEALEAAYKKGDLKFPGKLAAISRPEAFKHFVKEIGNLEWINYAKRPFAGPEVVVKYIGRYTHKVAIANSRLLDIDHKEIRFRYKDYKDGGKSKEMVLSASEFLRRFLLHTLPKGFKRIRHYGILASGCCSKNLQIARQLLAEKVEETKEFANLLNEKAYLLCPNCQSALLRFVEYITPRKMSFFFTRTSILFDSS